MTGLSLGWREPSPHVARRLRTLVVGRQTRTDVVVSSALLVVASVAMLANLVFAGIAFTTVRACVTATCADGPRFDVFVLSFLVSLLLGATFGVHAVLHLLNGRRAWWYSLLDATVSVTSLLAGLIIAGAVSR